MSTPVVPPNPAGRTNPGMDQVVDHRERCKLEEQERDWQRTQRLQELRSEFKTIPARIRAWEKLHGLRLPTNPDHPALHAISAATGIPVATLRDEQQARREGRPTAPVEVNDAPSAPSPDSTAK